jgi:hypothetical protein
MGRPCGPEPVTTSGKKAGMNVAKVIEFYKPRNFRTNAKWIPAERRGKIFLFVPGGKKSACRGSKQDTA